MEKKVIDKDDYPVIISEGSEKHKPKKHIG